MTEREVKRAIKALDNAWKALEPLVDEDERDSVSKLRSDILEYVEYLERATWWRRDRAEA